MTRTKDKDNGRSNASRGRVARLEALETRELLNASHVLDAGIYESRVAEYSSAALDGVPGPIPLDVLQTTASSSAIVVTTALDVTNASDGVISLREALATSGVKTITFADSLKGQTIKLTKELAIPSKGVTLDASALWDGDANAPGITLDANAKCRILSSKSKDFSLVGLRLVNGQTSGDGGAIYASSCAVTLKSCVFESNAARNGGAVWTSGVNISILNSRFLDNTTTGTDDNSQGGALCLYGRTSSTVVANSLFVGNRSDYGGFACLFGATLTLNNVSVVDNVADYGGAIYAYQATVKGYNSLFALNVAINKELNVSATRPEVNNYDSTVTCVNCAAVTEFWDHGENNILINGERSTFVNPTARDYRLATSSKAIDAGNPEYALDPSGNALARDLRGAERELGLTVDIGAYEYEPASDRAASAYTVTPKSFLVNGPYYDADKVMDSSDSNQCWAASASSMLWYAGWGRLSGLSDEEDLFYGAFTSKFPNSERSDYGGIKWFLNNEEYSSVATGGFYRTLFSAKNESTSSYAYQRTAYGNSSSPLLDVATRLRSGLAVGMAAGHYNQSSGASGDSHSFAIYGYEYNPALDPTDPNYYTALYVVDSNDGGRRTDEKDRKLVTFNLEWRENIKIGSKKYGAYVITNHKIDQTSSAPVVIRDFTFLMQLPSKYELDGGTGANLYLAVKKDDAPIKITQSGASGSTFSPDKEIMANFSFYSNTTLSSSKAVQYKIYVDDELVATKTIKGVTKNKAISPSAAISLGRLASGTHFVTVALDTSDAIDESNENDNVFTTTINVSGNVAKLQAPVLATSATADSITVTWEKQANAKSYVITCGDKTYTASASDTSHQFTGLSSATKYTITARALGDAKKSFDSALAMTACKTKTWTTLTTPVLATSATTNSIAVTWESISNATGYEVACGAQTQTVDSTETSYVFTGLASDTTYAVKVRALGDSAIYKESSYATVSVKTKALTLLATPTIETDSTLDAVTVSWRTVPNAIGYELLCDNDRRTLDAGATSYKFTALASDTTYAIQIRALGDETIYKSSAYATASVKTKAPTKLDAPTVMLGETSEKDVAISWNAIENATRYAIEYAFPGENSYRSGGETTDVSFVLSQLAARATYNIRVRALGNGKTTVDSDYSQVAVAKTLGVAPTFETRTQTLANGAAIRIDTIARFSEECVAKEWRVAWGDGTIETITRTSGAITLAHYYAPTEVEKRYDVSIEVIDSNGGGDGDRFVIATHTAPGANSNALLEPSESATFDYDQALQEEVATVLPATVYAPCEFARNYQRRRLNWLALHDEVSDYDRIDAFFALCDVREIFE